MSTLRVTASVILCVVGCAACAPRLMAPPVPNTQAFPEFLFPVVPPAWQGSVVANRLEFGWRYLQGRQLVDADRELQAAAAEPGFYPGVAGRGYLALAREAYARAVDDFDAALGSEPDYVPALVGRGQALLGLDRSADALASFEAALAVDASLTEVRSRIDVLRFRVLQDEIDVARREAAAGRVDAAREAYERAIVASPDTGFLYRELAEVELTVGDLDAALQQARRATELGAMDGDAFATLARVYEARVDFASAADAFAQAARLTPDTARARALDVAAARARDTFLPDEFRAIGTRASITRGEMAALVGVRLPELLDTAGPAQVVVTDIQGHWAALWIAGAIRAGVMDEFPNHTFQPDVGIRRVDLATLATRTVAILAETQPALGEHLSARPPIADVPTSHLNYSDIATAVSSGVLTLPDGRFGVNETVSGDQALAAVRRLRTLADRSR